MPNKDRMTDSERINALLRHEKPDRVPVWPFAYDAFAAINANYSMADAYNNPEKALQAQRWCSQQYGWVSAPYLGYAAYGAWEFGGELKWPQSEYDQAPSIIRHPVQSEEDVLKLILPDVSEAGYLPLLMKFNQLALKERPDNEAFSISARVGGVFGVAVQACSAEKFLKWIIRKPDIAHHMLRLATDHDLQIANHWKKTFGTEGVLIRSGEATTSNQLISPKTFEIFAYPYLKELHRKTIEMGFKHIYSHICGEQNANLEKWAEIPMGNPGIISIGHEIDVLTAAKYFPNDIILGNLDPSIVQTGTPQEVYDSSKEIIEKGMQCPGGFIFSPGCQMPPKAPAINAWMLTKAAQDFGRYE